MLIKLQERMKNIIYRNLIDKKNNIADDSNIKKAIEIIKTEKEVYQMLEEGLDKLNKYCSYIKGKLKELKDLIGLEPDLQNDNYIYDENDIEEQMSTNYFENKIYSVNINSNELSTNKKIDENNNIEKLKIKYNDFVYVYNRLMRKINKIKKVLDNLDNKSNRKIKLTSYELLNITNI